MCARLRPLVQVWWEGPQNPVFPPHNGFYDNSIPGVNALNEFAPAPAPNTFYFTMSFDATEDLPNVRLSSADFATFPVTLPLSLLNSHNISGTVISIGLNVFLSWVPGAPTLVNLAKWAVRVANTHLGALGYFNKIPQPGPKVPRADMLPIMLPTAYGMGGYELPAQFAQLIPGVSSAESQSNDGIVNTVSMRGPNDAQVSNVANFPVQSLERHNLDTTAKATYWHLGINKTMDHGDEIGVFTVGETVSCMHFPMYCCVDCSWRNTSPHSTRKSSKCIWNSQSFLPAYRCHKAAPIFGFGPDDSLLTREPSWRSGGYKHIWKLWLFKQAGLDLIFLP